MRLVLQSVPQRAGPFGSRALIDFSGIRSALDDGGKRLDVVGYPDVPQPQRLASSFDSPIFRSPPGHEIEDSGQIDIDCVPLPASLALVPGVRFEPAAGPPAMLGWYRARRHGLAFSVGMRPAKNTSAFLRDLSLQNQSWFLDF